MTIEFLITNRKGRIFPCSIDEIDADLLEVYWCTQISKKGDVVYVTRNPKKPHKYMGLMHRIIMARVLERELDPKEDVDHWDLNGLNNTRSNLRIATRAQNMANTKLRNDNKLGFKGVVKDKKRFRAEIKAGGKSKHLGMFDTPEEAHAAYLEAAKKYHGDFARGE